MTEHRTIVNAAAPAMNALGWTPPAIAALLLVAGCASRQAPNATLARTAPTARRPSFDEVYRLTERRFESAHLLTPADGPMTGLEEGALAPLIVREVAPQSAASCAGHVFGSLISEDGIVRVDPSRPAVYFKTGRRVVNGQAHRVLAYCMFYDDERSPDSPIVVAVIRTLLDTDGFPLVWEIIESPEAGAPARRPQVLYVSRSLETAASDRFGPPLPDRRHSTERGWDDSPRTVVARVIEDGPMPLGPYVYIAAGTGRITTLHCRCSPAQMDAVIESTYYELVPLADVADLARDVLGRVFRTGAGDPLALRAGLPLETALRWPLEP